MRRCLKRTCTERTAKDRRTRDADETNLQHDSGAGAVLADAMNNTFTPSTTLVARGDENEVRTRIYSVNERTIQIDELSMPINIPSTATQEAETEN